MLSGWGYTSVYPLPKKQHLQYNKSILMHKVVHNKSLSIENNCSTLKHSVTKTQGTVFLFYIDLYKMGFSYSGPSCWNAQHSNLKNASPPPACTYCLWYARIRSYNKAHYCTFHVQFMSILCDTRVCVEISRLESDRWYNAVRRFRFLTALKIYQSFVCNNNSSSGGDFCYCS